MDPTLKACAPFMRTLVNLMGAVGTMLCMGCMLEGPPIQSSLSALPQISLYISEKDTFDIFSHPVEDIARSARVEFFYDSIAESRNCEVTLHGGSSRHFSPKHSLQLKLKGSIALRPYLPPRMQARCAPSSDDIILNAAAIDMSKIRNYLSMAATHRLGGVAPAVGFAELYINDSYYGLFNIVEKIDPTWVRNQKKSPEAFDLIKAVQWLADLRPKENPLTSYELKYGTSTGLEATMTGLAAFSGTCNDIFQRTDSASVFGYPMGVLFSGEHDGFGKNYYYLHTVTTNRFQIIRWDGDATWGRTWDGSISTIPWWQLPSTNALYSILWNDSTWRAQVKQRFEREFDAGLEAEMVSLVDSLYDLLREPLQRDAQKWGPILIPAFTRWLGVNHWPTYDSLNPKEFIAQDFSLIRSFIATSEQRMHDELAHP